MRSKTSILDLLNIFSITVVAGTLGSAVFFTRLYSMYMPWYWWWTLPSTVWVIYTVDHLLDGLKVKEKAQTLRHKMHYKYRKLIFWLAGIISAFNIYLVLFHFNNYLLDFGVTLSAMVGVYLIIYQLFNRSSKKSYFKEIIVAAIYVLGIAGGPYFKVSFINEEMKFVTIYFLIALCNLFIFSLFDYQKDKANGFTSLAQSIGFKNVHGITLILLLVALLQSIYLYEYWPFAIVTVAMTVGLFALLAFPKWFAVNDRYRFLGDGVFLFPLILLGV